MKRKICLVLIVLMIMMLPLNSVAAGNYVAELKTVYFEDGSYLEIVVQSIESRASGSKTGTKTYTYNSSSGEVQWKAILRGVFTYTGTNASCTTSSCDVEISNTSWYVVTKNVGKSGNSATAELTMGLKYLGITVNKKTVNMKLTCDSNGNLS